MLEKDFQIVAAPAANGAVVIVDIYCRSAAEDGNTLAAQEAACRQYAKDNGFVIGEVFSEVAPGLDLKRDELERLRGRYGAIGGIVVVTLDRLTRSTVDFLRLNREMQQQGVTIYAVKGETGSALINYICRAMQTVIDASESKED